MDNPGLVKNHLIFIFKMASMTLLLYSSIITALAIIVEGGDFHICYANVRSSYLLTYLLSLF